MCSTGCSPAPRPLTPNRISRPVIGSRIELDEWTALPRGVRLARRDGAARRHRHEPARLRDGRRADVATRHGEKHGIALVMSHFACSEEDHPLNAKQMARFRRTSRAVPGRSAARFPILPAFSLGSEAHHDLVRPGVALYGANPTPGSPTRCGPWSDSTDASCRCATSRPARRSATARPGPPGGRRGSQSFQSAMPMASCAPRARATASRAPTRSWRGIRCPLAGRVSMDLIAVDVTGLPVAT